MASDQPTACPHMSASGDEGPVEQLGRSPYRWRCDGCDEIFYTCRACGCSPEQHDPTCLHKCSGWFAEDFISGGCDIDVGSRLPV